MKGEERRRHIMTEKEGTVTREVLENPTTSTIESFAFAHSHILNFGGFIPTNERLFYTHKGK